MQKRIDSGTTKPYKLNIARFILADISNFKKADKRDKTRKRLPTQWRQQWKL